ncbi:hypothetical protein A1359_03320 [Methylomonas lenta]|uniref:Glycosyl transferase n=1 Tax=Methylomonas lenta TaxID=980561 RepID=A0A177NRK2_9GAMM|nr:hypothetical protein [Methylomonas lenta]OAI20502.1 hypothetical protein A1359_03320 [Methylomonas lenta]
MFYQLKDKISRFKFLLACKRIYKTPPVIAQTEKPVAVLTQLQHKDVLLFLIAIKSFTKNVAINKVIIINDGSLTSNDLNTLKTHIPICEIHEAKEFVDDNCPMGGCWERLLAIAHFVQDYYVIQLDSDTLTISDIPEINHNIDSQTGFVIGTWDNQTIESMSICSKRVNQNVLIDSDSHVQMLAEANFDKLANIENLNYVRGCAGFTGFPQKSFDKDFVVELSQAIENIIGKKWYRWGSEQVMSNIVIANINKNMVLPHPKYCDCTKIETQTTSFIHFIGECRFKSNTYQELAKEIIDSLK